MRRMLARQMAFLNAEEDLLLVVMQIGLLQWNVHYRESTNHMEKPVVLNYANTTSNTHFPVIVAVAQL